MGEGGREGGQAGRGWIPDGLSGLPTVGSEAPLVSVAPSALIQLHSKSLLWNASETQPASPHSLPATLSRHQRQHFPSRPLLSFLRTNPLEVERVRAGNLAGGRSPALDL